MGLVHNQIQIGFYLLDKVVSSIFYADNFFYPQKLASLFLLISLDVLMQ